MIIITLSTRQSVQNTAEAGSGLLCRVDVSGRYLLDTLNMNISVIVFPPFLDYITHKILSDAMIKKPKTSAPTTTNYHHSELEPPVGSQKIISKKFVDRITDSRTRKLPC